MNSNLKLKDYFPMIQTREEILKKIKADNRLDSMFAGWTTENREEFLDFCTGQKGVKILYDAYFKEVMNPEY